MNRTPGDTPAARTRYWTKIIAEARGHTGGIKAYCSAKNISVDSYYFWFKRLRDKHPEWQNLSNNGNGSRRTEREQPEIEVVEKERPVRRKFTAAYKARILKEIDAAPAGGVAAILRREGLYSSHLQQWRAEESRRASDARKRGPKRNPLTAEVRRLREENARLEKKLNQANNLIELQKKIASILETTMEDDTLED